MAMIEAIGNGKLVLLVAALALVLAMTGCATTGTTGAVGPVSSHGVDYAPSFNPNEGEG